MSKIADIADAVVAAINALTLTPDTNAFKAYSPVYDLADLSGATSATPYIIVTPSGVTARPEARNVDAEDYELDIAVLRKIQDGETDNTVIEQMLTLVEAIRVGIRRAKLTSTAASQCVQTVNDPIYLESDLREKRQFSSLIKATFRVYR